MAEGAEAPSGSDPRTLHPHLHIGTSSWSSENWVGPFYPPGTRPGDFLRYYSTRYSTVEVDSSFYRAPSIRMCRKWADVTPANFTFALKVPQTITHEKVLVECGAEWEQFVAAAECLGTKLGFLVLQFGYFNKSSECPALGEFLSRLDRFVEKSRPSAPIVVEIRNKSWLGTELIDFLHPRKLILALTEQEWMPKIGDLWEKHGMKLVTGPAVYVRLLGERKRIEAITTSWDKIVIDRREETREWISILKRFLSQPLGLPVWVLINNHWAGHAPASIDMLVREWAGMGNSGS